MSTLIFREAKLADIEGASQLACATFQRFVAPLYSSEGNAVFMAYTEADTWRARHEAGQRSWVALDGASIVGVAHVRDQSHLSELFVHSEYQRRGIARRLLSLVQRDIQSEHITVNASPNAVSAYKRLGFEPIEPEQEKSGIRFTPMRRNCENRPNQALQHNDPSCHESCLRTPRASRGRG
jgi:ribosomal protein S18 acetylase RimI-like enzyme